MKDSSLTRFSPLQIGKLQTRNRIVVPAMASQTADVSGFVTENTLEHYDRLASSGAGIVMVEYTYVSLTGKSEANQLAVDSDDKISRLFSLASRIKKSGALSFLQLTHSLAKSSTDLTGGELLGASSVAVPVKDRDMQKPRAMTSLEILQLKSDFIAAAARASEAGFDGIELHSAHGYGLNQLLSPLTNQRKDEYGGPLKNRARLLFEVVAQTKAKFSDLVFSVRVPGQDNIEGGLTTEEMKKVARELETLGVDIINVSSGLGGWRRPGGRAGEGYLVGEAAELQRGLEIPVIGVGGIESGSYIDQSLRDRKFSLAAVGRSILKDPQEFYKNVLTNEGVKNEHNRNRHQ